MNKSDAASVAAPGRPHPAPSRGRIGFWGWALLALGALALAALAGVVLAVNALHAVPVTLTIDGQRVLEDWQLAQLPPAHQGVVAALVMLALLAALVALPLSLLLGAITAGAILLAVVGLPLLLVLALTALLCAPLLMLAWWLWRRLRRQATRPSDIAA